MTKLTTHVLDVYSGKPGKGIKVDLFFLSGDSKEKINSIILNNDGRSDFPLVEKENFKSGKYELVFYIGDYFKNIIQSKDLPFLGLLIFKTVRIFLTSLLVIYKIPFWHTFSRFEES